MIWYAWPLYYLSFRESHILHYTDQVQGIGPWIIVRDPYEADKKWIGVESRAPVEV